MMQNAILLVHVPLELSHDRHKPLDGSDGNFNFNLFFIAETPAIVSALVIASQIFFFFFNSSYAMILP